jgi:hypothetical protein
MFEEVRVNELNYLVAKGLLVASGSGYILSAKGLAEFVRLNESLDAQSQVLIAFKIAANAEKSAAQIKAFMV